METSEYYRCVDPIHNLKVRVVIEKVQASKARRSVKKRDNGKEGQVEEKNGDNDNDNEKDDDDTTKDVYEDIGKQWSAAFEWQQKVYGPREVAMYTPKSLYRPGHPTPLDRQYMADVKTKRDNGDDDWDRLWPEHQSVDKKRKGRSVWLFTYTDKDAYIEPRALSKSTDSTAQITKVSREIIEIPQRAPPSHFSAAREIREGTNRTMYIMAAVDLTPKHWKRYDHEGQGHPKNPDFKVMEIPICKIVSTADSNLLSISPPFGNRDRNLKRDEDDQENAKGKKNRKKKNKKKGSSKHTFSIVSGVNGTYNFRTPMGSLYRYTIFSDIVPDEKKVQELEELEQKIQKRTIAKDMQRVEKEVVLLSMEQHNYMLHHFFMGQILKVNVSRDCIGTHLFLQYQIRLPSVGWKWPNDVVDRLGVDFVTKFWQQGRSQLAQIEIPMDGQGIPLESAERNAEVDNTIPPKFAVLACPLEFELLNWSHNLAGTHHCQPEILFQVYSIDSWGMSRIEGYGSMLVPVTAGMKTVKLDLWKPLGSIRNRMNDFFIGGANFLVKDDYVSIPSDHSGPFLNRYGFPTKTTGSIEIVLQSAIQHVKMKKTRKGHVEKEGKAYTQTVEELLGTLRTYDDDHEETAYQYGHVSNEKTVEERSEAKLREILERYGQL